MQFNLPFVKDLGLKREVMDALPYAVVGGAWEASFENPVDEYVALSHIVPAGLQLKVLLLRVWTQEAGGARFSIEQTNPLAAGLCLLMWPLAFPREAVVPRGSLSRVPPGRPSGPRTCSPYVCRSP